MAEIIDSLYRKKGDTLFYSRIIKDNPSCYLVSGQIFYDGYGIISQTIDRKEKLNSIPDGSIEINKFFDSRVSECYDNEYSRHQRNLIIKIGTKSEKTNLVTLIGLFFLRAGLEMSILDRLHKLKIGDLCDSDIGTAGISISLDVFDWKESVKEVKKLLDKKGLSARARIFLKINFQTDVCAYDCVYPSFFEGSFMDW